MVKPMTTLQSALRGQLGFTATKEGCRHGGCGSCTVLVNGEPMLSCLLPIEDVAGQRVTTLESLTPAQGLHPLQQAFLDTNVLVYALATGDWDGRRDEIADAALAEVARFAPDVADVIEGIVIEHV